MDMDMSSSRALISGVMPPKGTALHSFLLHTPPRRLPWSSTPSAASCEWEREEDPEHCRAWWGAAWKRVSPARARTALLGEAQQSSVGGWDRDLIKDCQRRELAKELAAALWLPPRKQASAERWADAVVPGAAPANALRARLALPLLALLACWSEPHARQGPQPVPALCACLPRGCPVSRASRLDAAQACRACALALLHAPERPRNRGSIISEQPTM